MSDAGPTQLGGAAQTVMEAAIYGKVKDKSCKLPQLESNKDLVPFMSVDNVYSEIWYSKLLIVCSLLNIQHFIECIM